MALETPANLIRLFAIADKRGLDIHPDALREVSRRLFEKSGFHEYYDPLTGDGLGGTRFSWTAATWLHWAR